MPINLSKDGIEAVVAKIHEKYPTASFDKEILQIHKDFFDENEDKLNINNIAIRGVTDHYDNDDDENPNIAFFTYHWVCWNGANSNLEAYFIHYHATPPVHGRKPVLNQFVERFQLKKGDWQICQNEVDTLKIHETYFVPTPDPSATHNDELFFSMLVNSAALQCASNPGYAELITAQANQYIKSQFEDLLEEYHQTYNEYHLARADFYRKLKISDMLMEHRVLAAAAYEGEIEPSLLEKKFREYYTDKIGSL
ncbi:Protein CBG05050 [Caenorhabditis briggsae]|uniref:Protein CBG05050 n=2 Tax=Caenorhabditis briggsae TaxID=6238 RepID=A8WZ22_CAEBR|nr:Protein CBG05050 [Caenorhabditis briggsae]ULT82750.1 hypothetical protein L3Y34_012174 [Caenorhabditis briggsae]CAP25632.1 Protein CBG05050 [Caenorhabditis briggsae]